MSAARQDPLAEQPDSKLAASQEARLPAIPRGRSMPAIGWVPRAPRVGSHETIRPSLLDRGESSVGAYVCFGVGIARVGPTSGSTLPSDTARCCSAILSATR